jgi:hypothetical protein
MFMGSCREHNHKVPLEFSSERELDLFCDALDNGDIHLASEVSFLVSMIKILVDWFIPGNCRCIRVSF